MGSAPPSPSPAAPSGSGAASGAHPVQRDRVAGFSIIFVAFAAALFISWKASDAVKPNVAPPPAPPTREGLVGYPGHVDPVTMLPLAEALTERQQLRRIAASGVAYDGTVDLSVPGAGVRYEFDSAPGEGPEPPRPPGTVRAMHYCGRQTVHVKEQGIFADADQPRAPCRSQAGAPLPEPRCRMERLWAIARERGAPTSARADIEYFRAHGGPAWRFSLPEAKLNFTLFGDCERELRGKEARPVAG